MIHQAWSAIRGTPEEHRQEADRLQAVNRDLLEIYAQKMKRVDRDRLIEWIKEEAWFGARQALEIGLIDGIRGEGAQALSPEYDILLHMYAHTPPKAFADAFMREPEYRDRLQVNLEKILEMMR
jgi:enoyl-CoA hydratase/carnithine racemase